MISSTYDIKEFVNAVKDKDYLEVITLAEREALDAWRSSHQRRREAEAENEVSRRYETVLKEFVRYVRSGIAIPKDRQDFPEHLFSLHRELQAKKSDD